MYKISNILSPLFTRELMTEICVPYNTRSITKVEIDDSGDEIYEIPSTKTVSYGLDSIRYLGPKIWKLIHNELKELKSLKIFEKKSKV